MGSMATENHEILEISGKLLQTGCPKSPLTTLN